MISIFCAPYLLDIISDSFASSIFPTSLKTAVIRPILKKTGLEKNNLNNYRPITQLSVFSKIIECVASKQIMKHLIRHNNIPHCEKNNDISITLLMTKLNWMSITNRIKYKACIYIHTAIHHDSPSYLTECV